jgi:hypothetical protein
MKIFGRNNKWRHNAAERLLNSHHLQNLNTAPAILTSKHMKTTADIKYRNVVSPTLLLCNDVIDVSLRQDTSVTLPVNHEYSRNTEDFARILIKKF